MDNSHCPYCGAKTVIKNAYFIYHTPDSKSYGNILVCGNYPSCNSYVSCHKGTNKPMGRLANKELRETKMKAHRYFDPLWKSGKMNRSKAYKWLALKLDIPVNKCHIGMFDIDMCHKVIEVCKEFNP